VGNSLSEFSSTGVANAKSPFTGGGLNGPYAVAVDTSGNIWVTNSEGNSISEFSSSGTAISPATTGYIGGGLSSPSAIAIDGSSNVWIANELGNSISEFNSSGTAISGSSGYTGYTSYMGGTLKSPYGIAIDGSGNIWAPSYSGNTITEFVGAATPVVTPIVANLLPPYGSSAVNKP
jgi:streptogramin lyase